MRLLGIALVILGVVALIYGGVSYSRQRTILEVGGLKATATEHKSIPFPPIAGAILVAGGVGVLALQRRRIKT